MLFIANARAVRVSTCFSSPILKLPPRRLASLTGAIQRGARKAKDVGERTDRYNSRSNSDIHTAYREDNASRARWPASSDQQYVRKREAGPGQYRQREDSRRDSAGESRYSRDDAVRPTLNQRPERRFASREGDQSRFTRTRDAGRDHGSDSKYTKKNTNESAREFRQSERFSQKEGGRSSFHERRDRGRDFGGNSSYSRSGSDGFDRDRRPAELFSQRDGDRSSFPRKPSERNGSLRRDEREQTQSRYPDPGIDKLAQGRRAASFPTAHEEVRHSLTLKSGALRRPVREESGSVRERPGQDGMLAKRHVAVPLSIPRSSAASEFIYGTSAVKAAIQADNRILYKLYIYQGASGTEEREGDREFYKLAQRRGLNVKRLGGDDLRLLDKMAQGRPHNGYVLEASQLPNTPVEALDSVAEPGEGFSFTAGHQSAEEISVNGTSCEIPGSDSRYPFVLMLDSILDPGNLGAIIRTAAFFGVDAIALVDHNLAPFSPVTLKASSGAAEYMRYLRIKKDYEFVKRSRSNGWKFFAAVAPESASARRRGLNTIRLKEAEKALREGPCVLMLGGEGDGLRTRLQKAADGMIGIDGAGGMNSEFGLDSLNVSVAAGLMMQIFVKGSTAHADADVSGAEAEESRDGGQLF